MLEKQSLDPGLELIARSSAEATEQIKPTSRSSATATGATFVGPQLADGSGRVRKVGTDKPEVENSRGLGARRRCQSLCAITQRSFLSIAHIVIKVSAVSEPSNGARQAGDVDLFDALPPAWGHFARINWILCAPRATAAAACAADRPRPKQEETHSEPGLS